ncbi:Crp/Fnr family transcriptional regulator [Ekhidna sp.]|uniref:Crp/Fnr family transcriptional regulator n=1 Tax=Ekhidna sp. TaxID=2608089 RepID=UPI003CCBA197
MNQLLTFINQHSTLTDTLTTELNEIMDEVSVSAGTEISSQNTYCRQLYFIKKGVVKFCFNSEGKEFIMRFFEEGVLFTDLLSWNKKECSEYRIVALENTEFFSLPFLQFEELCNRHHALETFYRKFITQASLNMMERIKEILEEDAQKRYSNFVEKHPGLLQRVSLGDISKYLGITQVTLSRIRANK